MKKVDLEIINNDYEKFDKDGLYQRLDMLIKELGYKNTYAFSPDKLIYNLKQNRSLPNFKTIFFIDHVCKSNGKDLDLNWFCWGRKVKAYKDKDSLESIVEELKIDYLTKAESQLKEQIKSLEETVKSKDKLIKMYEEKLGISD